MAIKLGVGRIVVFAAILAREADGEVAVSLEAIDVDDLPTASALVEVSHSALNFKDALAVCGNRNKIMKALPFVPGIDLAGTVLECSDGRFSPGDKVFATGWGLGERHWGGFSVLARLNSDWLLPLPTGLDSQHTMAVGTAGLTAMLCVEALEHGGVLPQSGEVLVTGVSGGVGSLAAVLLAKLGYQVAGSTGRPEQAEYLQSLGVKRIVSRAHLDRDPRPLEKETYAGVIDTVGNKTLSSALAQTSYGGVVAVCGLVGGYVLPTTVMPFILRGVRLQGIDSVYLPNEQRAAAWERLALLLPAHTLVEITQLAKLSEVPDLSRRMLDGKLRGRTVIRMET